MVAVPDHFREVIAQSVGTADLFPVYILVAGRRLVLVCGRVSDIVCRETIELVVLLAIVVQTALYPEVEVLDDMPSDSRVESPVLPDPLTVIVRNGKERRSIVSVVLGFRF